MNVLSPVLNSYGKKQLFWVFLVLAVGQTSLAMDKDLFNVILGHLSRRAAQLSSMNYMHWQLAQQQNQNINWEAERQVGINVCFQIHSADQMGGFDFKKDFCLFV